MASDDDEDATHLVRAIQELESFIRNFDAALALFNFSTSRSGAVKEMWFTRRAEIQAQETLANVNLTSTLIKEHESFRNEITLFSDWASIAVRDGAMQIYNFGIVMTLVRQCLPKVPAILKHTDVPALRAAIAQMKKEFPHFERIRHASAHSIAELMTTKEKHKREAADLATMPEEFKHVVEGEGKGAVVTGIIGNKVIVTKDNQFLSYEISVETRNKMEAIRQSFVAGFTGARRAVWDKWIGELPPSPNQ